MEVQRLNLWNPTTPTDDDGGIPDELLFEVLLRLPLNSVFTCRCVSKRWLSIASDPYFIRAYVCRASSSSHWIVLSPLTSQVSYDPNPSPSSYILPRDLYLRPHLCKIGLPGHDPSGSDLHRYIVVGASNGLVLYYSGSRRRYNFYIYNPITGHWIKACKTVLLTQTIDEPGWGFLTRVDGEFVLKSYRIIRAKQSRENCNAMIFEVYYSEMDEWKKFTLDLAAEPVTLLTELQEVAAVINGILHWADIRIGVIVFDPEASTGKMRLIRYPRDVDRVGSVRRSNLCVAYGGELKYIAGYLGDRHRCIPGFAIWKLEDSGEWCLQHRVESMLNGFFDVQIDTRRIMDSVIFDPFNSDVVFYIALDDRLGRRSVFSYNLKSGKFNDRGEMIVDDDGPFSFQFDKLPWTVSLVVPPWPTHLSEKHLERRVCLFNYLS